MPEFVRRFERHYETNYWLNFTDPTTGALTSFPCNVDGNPLDLNEYCQALYDGYVEAGLKPWRSEVEHAWNEYAIIVCPRCRRHVELCSFTNTCECGADFNMEGALLADRSQWGEETGETAADILVGGDDEW